MSRGLQVWNTPFLAPQSLRPVPARALQSGQEVWMRCNHSCSKIWQPALALAVVTATAGAALLAARMNSGRQTSASISSLSAAQTSAFFAGDPIATWGEWRARRVSECCKLCCHSRGLSPSSMPPTMVPRRHHGCTPLPLPTRGRCLRSGPCSDPAARCGGGAGCVPSRHRRLAVF